MKDPFASITLIALLAVAILLGVAVRTDLHERRIPNGVVLGLVGVWLLWRLSLGACTCWMEATGQLDSSFPLQMRFCAGAWDATPLGLPSAADGLLAAVVFGVGLLLLTLVYEAVLKREALGGGDVKLMAALALFLGPGRSMLCLLVACIVALATFVGARWHHRKSARNALQADGNFETGLDADDGTMPFAPALACGASVSLLPGVIFWLVG